MARLTRASRFPAKPAPETRFEAGDVMVPGEPDSLAAAEIRLLQGDEIRGSVTAILRFDWF